MNPLGGGILGYESKVVRNLLPDSKLSPAALALKFVLNNPNVSCAISGFSKINDVEENVQTAMTPSLSDQERKVLGTKVSELKKEGEKFCTQCGYCLPCEKGVDIKGIFYMANYARLFDLKDWARKSYANLKPETRADRCTKCGKCEEKCTNKLAIREELEKAHALLS